MNNTHRIVWGPLAQAQAEMVQKWWLENRGGDLLEREIDKAAALLAQFPDLGAEMLSRPGVRKLLLKRTQHYVYYRVEPKLRVVRIVAFWHTSRGDGPPL